MSQLSQFEGECIAIVHRLDDDDDKLIVVLEGVSCTDEEIRAQTNFQERFFQSVIIRNKRLLLKMAIWLLKTEPTVYSYADLERDGFTMWDGVNNNTALQNIRKMVEGDMALIYHTGDERQVVGIAEVVRGYYVNPEKDDSKLAVCNVKARQRLENPITLGQIKSIPEMASSSIVRLGRLSVVPISEEEWKMMQTASAGKSAKC